MKYLIVSPEYVAKTTVIDVFKQDARRLGMKMCVLRERVMFNGIIQYEVEGNKDGCGFWYANVPEMGYIIDDNDIPQELFEI